MRARLSAAGRPIGRRVGPGSRRLILLAVFADPGGGGRGGGGGVSSADRGRLFAAELPRCLPPAHTTHSGRPVEEPRRGSRPDRTDTTP